MDSEAGMTYLQDRNMHTTSNWNKFEIMLLQLLDKCTDACDADKVRQCGQCRHKHRYVHSSQAVRGFGASAGRGKDTDTAVRQSEVLGAVQEQAKIQTPQSCNQEFWGQCRHKHRYVHSSQAVRGFGASAGRGKDTDTAVRQSEVLGAVQEQAKIQTPQSCNQEF